MKPPGTFGVWRRNKAGLAVPHQFRTPVAQLHPYLKECVRDLDNHGFCRVDAELIVDRTICTSDQLEMFREACRNVSNDKDQNLDFDDKLDPPNLVIHLMPKGMEGALPQEKYVEDPDGGGVLETGPGSKSLIHN